VPANDRAGVSSQLTFGQLRSSDALTLLRSVKRPAGPLRVRYLKEIEKLQFSDVIFTATPNNKDGIRTDRHAIPHSTRA